MSTSYELINIVGAFVVWGFVMAFLYSIASAINKTDKGSVYLSFVMLLSYSSTFFIDYSQITYLDYTLLDLITIIALVLVAKVLLKFKPVAYSYLITGLAINGLLALAMYFDVFIYGNYEPWLLWDIYTICISLVDFTMVLILVINKDFFKLVWLLEKLNVLWVKCNSQEKRID